MLKQRIITAILMLAILLPAVFYPDARIFAALTLVLIGAAGWEWGRLNLCSPAASLAVGGACAVLCVTSWYAGWLDAFSHLFWTLAGSAWVALGVWLLCGGVQAWTRVPQGLRLVGGVLALWVAWLAVAKARMVGINFLFSVLVLVWVADIFAYFAGRTLGGRLISRKLAPTISPGKTWEGACGGIAGVLLSAFVWRHFDALIHTNQASLYSRLGELGSGFMLVALVFLAAMSIVGDLVESLFKRSAGVKDSSGLLPGHGGVLDRIDALLPVLPLAMMLSTL